MSKYKEVSKREAQVLHALGITFQFSYDPPNWCDWRPYPNPPKEWDTCGFRVVVEEDD